MALQTCATLGGTGHGPTPTTLVLGDFLPFSSVAIRLVTT